MTEEIGVEGAARIARALDRLGMNDAATQMGALENLAAEVQQGLNDIADAIRELASAVRDHGDNE